jgi:translation elongation factor EF-4
MFLIRAKCHGGDITRKRELKSIGRISNPLKALTEVLKPQ